MNRKIKMLGLALVAALALTAVTASAASAAGNFTSSAAHTALSGEQSTNHEFTAGSGFGVITCTTATFAGTQAGTTATSIKITPTYANCSSLGSAVHIVKNTLLYEFTRTGKDGSGTPIGSVHMTGEIHMTKTAGVDCTITIKGAQTLTGQTYHNTASGVTVTTNTGGIKSTLEGGVFGCGTSETSPTAGTYKGTTNMVGNAGAAKISVD